MKKLLFAAAAALLLAAGLSACQTVVVQEPIWMGRSTAKGAGET